MRGTRRWGWEVGVGGREGGWREAKGGRRKAGHKVGDGMRERSGGGIHTENFLVFRENSCLAEPTKNFNHLFFKFDLNY
jgi:hypothetical protein